DDAEAGRGVLRDLGPGKVRADADHRRFGADGEGGDALDGAAAALAHAHRHLAVVEAAGRGQGVPRRLERRLAVRVGRVEVERGGNGLDLFVGKAENVAGELFPFALHADGDLAFEV